MRIAAVIAVFLALIVLLALGLRLDPREVPSPLIGKPAPHFDLPVLQQPGKTFSEKDLQGRVWILNVWASWCVACRDEHPVLVEFSKSAATPLYGLNYKDSRDDALGWLKRFGDPYRLSAFDLDGRIGIDYGVYGVPETYVIDKRGVIRYKRIGAVTGELVRDKLVPLLNELDRE